MASAQSDQEVECGGTHQNNATRDKQPNVASETTKPALASEKDPGSTNEDVPSKVEEESMELDDKPSKEPVKPDISSATEAPSDGASEDDPFAYIKEKGFTTEIFKIEIQNLPKKFGIQVKHSFI